MVALNYQTKDTSMLINSTLFRLNNKCGYVRKPEIIRNPEYLRKYGEQKSTKFRLTILSAYQLPLASDNYKKANRKSSNPNAPDVQKLKKAKDIDVVDPYVEIDIYSFDQENPRMDKPREQKFKTQKVKNNGINPQWTSDMNNEFEFTVVKDTSFIVIKVKDSDRFSEDEDLGRAVIPLRYARTGCRHVFLEAKHGNENVVKGASSVFVKLVEGL